MKKTIEVRQCDYCDKTNRRDSIYRCVVCGKDICFGHANNIALTYRLIDVPKLKYFNACKVHSIDEFIRGLGVFLSQYNKEGVKD